MNFDLDGVDVIYLYESENCSIYYETATNECKMYLEKKKETPEEEKERIKNVLREAKYDPKTKTIEVNGQKARFTLDEKNPYAALTNTTAVSDKWDRRGKKSLPKTDFSNIDSIRKGIKDDDTYIKQMKGYLGRTAYNKSLAPYKPKAKYNNPNASGLKVKGINVGKKEMDIETLQHEMGHVKDISNRRRAEAEPSFVAKYGTSELSKAARMARLKANKLRKKGDLTEEEKKHLERLDAMVAKSIKETEAYKKDKGQQKRDAIEAMDKDIIKELKKKSNIGLNMHDRYIGEYPADSSTVKTKEGRRKIRKSLNRSAWRANTGSVEIVEDKLKDMFSDEEDYKKFKKSKKGKVLMGATKGAIYGASAIYQPFEMVSNHKRTKIGHKIANKHQAALEHTLEILRGNAYYEEG